MAQGAAGSGSRPTWASGPTTSPWPPASTRSRVAGESMSEILKIAFRDKMIVRLDHPVLQTPPRGGLSPCLPDRSWTPTGRSGWSISSSRPRRANGPSPFAWWPGSSDRAGPLRLWQDDLRGRRSLPIRPAPMRCSSPTSRRPSWVAISPWAGPSRPGSWISTRSSATGPTASPRRTGRPAGGVGLARPGRHGRGREGSHAEPWRPGAAPGRQRSGRPCWPTASPTSRHWPGCSRRCSRSSISPGRGLLRGRYMAAVARMERAGVPIDVPTLRRLRAGWEAIQDRLIREVDSRFGVFDGRTFKADRWAALAGPDGPPVAPVGVRGAGPGRRHVPGDGPVRSRRGPDAGAADLPLPTPALAIWRSGPTAGTGRCSARSGPRRAGTSRPTPGSSSGRRRWLRGLIKPEPGRAVAYVDWSQQEFGIAAALSGDRGDDGRLPIGRPLPGVRQAGRPDPARRDQADPRGRAGAVQGVRPGRPVRHGGRRRWPGGSASRRPTAGSCSGSIGRPTRRSGPGPTGPSLTRCSRTRLQTVFGWTVRVGPDANPRSPPELPVPGERGRDAAAGLLPGDGAGDLRRRPGP